MFTFTAAGRPFQADLLVFDKDGLMFDSAIFWRELTNVRVLALLEICNAEDAVEWARLLGADTTLTNGAVKTNWVNPLGIMAVASPFEERTVTAGFLTLKRGWMWHQARERTIALFQAADRALDLRKALRPQPGFVRLMSRLMELDVPYGVATSDTLERTRASMSLYGCWDKVRFVITPEDVREGKPAPDMLMLISKRTQVPLGRIAMIGDSYVDVKMAHAVGSIGIGVSQEADMREKMVPYASAVLQTLEELMFS